MAILNAFAALCLFDVVFLHKPKQGRVTVCSLNSQISPASKNRAPIHHESAKSLKPGQSLISSPRHGYCDVFLWANVFNVIGSGLYNVRSGTSMTTCRVVNANILYTLIHLDNSTAVHAQSVDYLRVLSCFVM